MEPTPRMADAAPQLTISQLAERTGVPGGTLRMWETRHGFPVPARLPSGHRRYAERDVQLVLAVIRRRDEGLSLSAAILRAREDQLANPASIFAGLREQRPELQPMILGKGALLALSRAIEDEHCARATSGVLIGSFQRARFYRQSERRWRELARTARAAVALADFKARRHPRSGPHEVPVSREHPLSREWSIVFKAPGACACLAAWEVPSVQTVADSRRRFEVLWSPDPEVVHTAVAVAAELVATLAPEVGRELNATLQEPVAPSTRELRSAGALAHRMLAYLGGGPGAMGTDR